MENDIPTQFLNVITPRDTPMFVVTFFEKIFTRMTTLEKKEIVIGKFFRIYKPLKKIKSKAFPMMIYVRDENSTIWKWERPELNWINYDREILNMKNINISAAIVSNLVKFYLV